MKQSILFVVTYFDCGGINRSLQNLLNFLDVNRYDADVFGMVPDGMFVHLYKNCRVLPRNTLLSALMARFSQQHGIHKLLSLIIKSFDRLTKGRLGYSIKLKAARDLVRNKQYDAVVAFSEGVPTSFVSLMNHPNSIAWVHCDYASYMGLNGGKDELPIYNHYKHIVCVAEYPRMSFVNCYPELAPRTTTIYNIHDVDMMRSLAKEEVPVEMDEEEFNIVSLGRLDPVKRLSVVPAIAGKLIDAGCAFKWYVIGPRGGTDEEYHKLVSALSDSRIKERVRYLGEKKNPYPYISRASLLVNTSISEACPYVVNEAKILHTPVVCTNFGSAKEFIDHGKNGFICAVEDIADVIMRYMKDPSLQGKIKQNVLSFDYDNDALMKQFYRVLE